MQTSQKIVYVYDSFSSEEPLLLGKLYISVIRGTESYSESRSVGTMEENSV